MCASETKTNATRVFHTFFYAKKNRVARILKSRLWREFSREKSRAKKIRAGILGWRKGTEGGGREG